VGADALDDLIAWIDREPSMLFGILAFVVVLVFVLALVALIWRARVKREEELASRDPITIDFTGQSGLFAGRRGRDEGPAP
jgi:uncharacterized membrane protein YqjE